MFRSCCHLDTCVNRGKSFTVLYIVVTYFPHLLMCDVIPCVCFKQNVDVSRLSEEALLTVPDHHWQSPVPLFLTHRYPSPFLLTFINASTVFPKVRIFFSPVNAFWITTPKWRTLNMNGIPFCFMCSCVHWLHANTKLHFIINAHWCFSVPSAHECNCCYENTSHSSSMWYIVMVHRLMHIHLIGTWFITS